MAFDGITVAALTRELNHTLTGGRITKIAQPEADELLITIKNQKNTYRLFLSADASLPLAYLTDANKPSPLTAPNFCMLLRKHIGSGRILSVSQPGLERVIILLLEHLNEMGDLCRKKLIVELMGRHSNLIFCDEENAIIDSIKHVPFSMSSVREVLPGRRWFIPATQEKLDPLSVSGKEFSSRIFSQQLPLEKALYGSLTGLSPLAARELCFSCGLSRERRASDLTAPEQEALFAAFSQMVEVVKEGLFSPVTIFRDREPVEFSALPLRQFPEMESRPSPSISQTLEAFYSSRNALARIRQKSADLRRIVQTALERSQKKYQLQLRQAQDTEKKDKYRIYGELLHTYGYSVQEGSRSLTALNYYTNQEISIPLDPQLTPQENAKKYFDRYQKLKRTAEALETLLAETRDETAHLETIQTALDIARTEDDLAQIKEELTAYGYIRRKGPQGKKVKLTSRPLHYVSSDGFHMYVGKNNYQNEELTFKAATGNDWWFHAKGRPGSHVIVKAQGEELPDLTFEEAARLAAYYSSGRNAPKVEIDYIQKKHVKKVSGGKPGFVIYHTNYSMVIEPDISDITELA